MHIMDAVEVAYVAAEIGVFEWPQSTSLSASQAEIPIGVLGPGPANVGLGFVQIHPASTFAASDSSYWEIQVFRRTAGGAGVLIAQGSSSVTLNNPIAFTAWTASSLVLTANASLTPGDAITGVVTKVGTPAALQFYLAGFVKIL